jgi:uncharacterized protein DUF4407
LYQRASGGTDNSMTNWIKKFFWVCSGATVSLLEECKTEHNKYVGIGATVLMTGILAGLSAGYALYTVFLSLKWSAVFGALWGLMIFNLDSFIILSIKKKEVDPSWNSAKKVKEKGLEILAVLPRLGLAVLLAFIITKPLELKLFEKEVGIEIEAIKREEEDKLQASSNPSDQTQQTTQTASKIKSLKEEVETLRQKIEDKKKQWNTAEQEANCECYGTCGTHRPGVGVNCERERGEAEILKNQYIEISNKDSEINKQISSKLKQVDDLEAVQAKLAGDARQKREGEMGLATRLVAFDRLTSRDSVYGSANLVLMLIFILLETAPILTKLFSAYGPYDKLLETAELKVSIGQMKQQIELVDEVIRTQESSDKHRKAMLDMQDSMLEEIKAEAKNARQSSAQVQAEWNQAKRELVRDAISTLRKHDGKSNDNGSK